MNQHEEMANIRLWAGLALSHFDLEQGLLPCAWNVRLTNRMGQAKCSTSRVTGTRTVTLEFSSQLWTRATPAEREQTAAHEAAHGVVWLKYGPQRRGRSQMDHHGPVWQETMRALGFEPKRCHNVSTAGIGRKTAQLSCGVCSAPLGACTPKRAAKLAAAYTINVRCCGKVPGASLRIKRIGSGN